ncbi:MAG: hypothetical protein ACRDMZ_18340, partial [Solirubrobacteraceae bacterium]
GPRRRFYRLTRRGRRNLDEIARLISDLRTTHDAFLAAHTAAVARRAPDDGQAAEDAPSS